MAMEFAAKLLALVGGRYFITAGLAFLVFYVLLRSRWASRKV